MTFMLTDVASAKNLIDAPMTGAVNFVSRLLVGNEDIAIVVTPGSIRVFVDDVEVRAGAQWSYINEHASKILEQVEGIFSQGSTQVAIIGRWLKIAGLAGIEPYVVVSYDRAGTSTSSSYALRIFEQDADLMPGTEMRFEQEAWGTIAAKLMQKTEFLIRRDDLPAHVLDRWPRGLFWYTAADQGSVCFAYEAVGRTAFARTVHGKALLESELSVAIPSCPVEQATGISLRL
jgi:hypothetical protein